MPNKLKIDALKSELSSVNFLLEEANSYGDFIGANQFDYKKKELEAKLSELALHTEVNASVALFFGGKPVLGSTGINADFAGKALSDFQDIINKISASLELGKLGSRGKTALIKNSQLMVTQIARGSFGFVLDEISDQIPLTKTSLKETVDLATKLIEDTAAPDQSNFEEALKELDHRTLLSLRDFFVDLDKNEATVRLVEGLKDIQLDKAEIKRARTRTENTSIKEDTTSISGELLGLLPEHRKFEFKLNNDEIIIGTCTQEAAEYYQQRLTNQDPIKRCSIEVFKRTVTPVNSVERSIYRLIKFDDQSNQ
jgi:hypothetical protein